MLIENAGCFKAGIAAPYLVMYIFYHSIKYFFNITSHFINHFIINFYLINYFSFL